MASQHQHKHGRVFNGILPRDEGTALDNKLRFIYGKHDNLKAEKVDVIGDDGKKHKVVKNGGLVHVHDFTTAQKNEVDGADGKKHVFNTNKNLGLVHNLGLSNKQEVDGADGKKHLIHKNNGLVHVLGEVNKGDKAVVTTIYSQVTVTQAKTFSGPATLVTETPGASEATGATDNTGAGTATASLNSAEAAYQSAKAAANAPDFQASSSPAAAVISASTPTPQASLSTGPLQNTRPDATHIKGIPHSTARPSPSVIGGTPLSQANSNDGTTASSSSKSGGMSPGASAGVAFAVLAAVALVGGLIFFCWRRRKQQKDREGAEKLDEKHVSKNSFFGGTAAAVGHPAGDLRQSVASTNSHSAATAPRLSLRPVTQFLPNIIGGGNNNNANGPQMSEKSKSGWDRTPAGAASNPFADAAVMDEKSARPVSPLNPFDEANGKKSQDWEGSEPATPKSTKFGTAAAVPVGAAGAKGAPAPGPNNVHRVQLDFKPSMDDELELKSGQLVRMLHEYDDGWCLCIRMDRSQQGVCPRTCLSKLPVKPRPQGPPPNGPQGACPRGPSPPGAQRPQSPASKDGMVPRPLTSNGRERSQTGPRSMSPAPNNRPRSQSMGGGSDRPASPSLPSRKPVPGMAL